ncbi:MAG: hypothetical protein ACXWDA_06115, partial [Aeromicrobium sp.]
MTITMWSAGSSPASAKADSKARRCESVSTVPPDLLDAYRTVSAMALAGVRHCVERAGDVSTLRLHGDC